MRVGAIDIGSNSIRLLVAELGNDGSLTTIARAGEACRLGRGLDSTGRIDPDLADRAAQLVAEFVRRSKALGARRLYTGATAALRRAANGPDVASAIELRSGVPVRILSGEDEAGLVHEAVVHGLGPGAWRTPCVVFDLGGGSTEVTSGLGLQLGRWTSLHFGAVTLTEKHLHHSPPEPDEVAALGEEVGHAIMHQCAYMPRETPLLAGVGGTVTVLAALDRGLAAYDPALLEGWTIPSDRLEHWVQRIVSSTEPERQSWAILGHGRSDIVAAGALVVGALARRFPSRGLVCSTQGLRYGLARTAAERGTDL
jgi:exopolyphosphatase/guanosine-5'-triphosphate,3'-diphosphate pyrophosphatase